MSHSPEPWSVCTFPCCCRAPEHDSWAIHDKGAYGEHPDVDGDDVHPVAKLLHAKVVHGVVAMGINQKIDAERIVACVNACAGIPTETLENSELRRGPGVPAGLQILKAGVLPASVICLYHKAVTGDGRDGKIRGDSGR